MMSESKTEGVVPGACLCEAIQYELDLPTLGSVHCHCTMCRRWNGAGYTTWCAIDKGRLRILSGKDQLVRYQSSDHAGRLFCSVCGSSLFGDSSRTPDTRYIVMGPLQGEIDIAPMAHMSIENKAYYIAIGDDLPQVEGVGDLETTQG